MEKIMSKSNDSSKLAHGTRARELTDDELNQVSGGKEDAPVKYMEFKLKEIFISSVQPSS
jgi:bacteriocin-like protein